MVEDVERFRAEFERRALLDGEMLVHRHIEVDLMWVARIVPRRSAEGESLRRSKGRRIHEQRAKDVRTVPGRDCATWITDKVRTRPRSDDAIGDTCVVSGNSQRRHEWTRDRVCTSVGNGKGISGRKCSNTGVLPASKKRMGQSRALKER